MKGAKAPEVKKPGEPIKLPSFGIDAGSIALPGEAQHCSHEECPAPLTLQLVCNIRLHPQSMDRYR